MFQQRLKVSNFSHVSDLVKPLPPPLRGLSQPSGALNISSSLYSLKVGAEEATRAVSEVKLSLMCGPAQRFRIRQHYHQSYLVQHVSYSFGTVQYTSYLQREGFRCHSITFKRQGTVPDQSEDTWS